MWWFLQSQSGFSTILSRAPELHQGQYCLEKRGLAFVLTSVSYWLQVALGRSIIGSEASPGAGDPVDFKRNVSIRLQSQDQELGTVKGAWWGTQSISCSLPITRIKKEAPTIYDT